MASLRALLSRGGEGVPVVLLTANLVWHTAALALPGGTLSACLPAFGNLARAGVQLVVRRLPAALTLPAGGRL